MLPPTNERIAKISSSLNSGNFDFEVIAQYRSNSPFWKFLKRLDGQSIGCLETPRLWQFTCIIAAVFDIQSREVKRCIQQKQTEISEALDAAWIIKLRRLECSLQDIPFSERSRRVCYQAIKSNPRDFYYVPEALKSQDLCLPAMKKEPAMLFFLPVHLQTKALYKTAVRNDGRLLTSVPEAYRCEEIYLAAVRQNGLSIEYISPLEINRRIAREAVKSNGEALQHVPFHLITKRLCDEAIRCEPFGAALPFVPATFRTERMIRRVLKLMPLALEHIPAENQSKLARMIAVGTDGMAIKFIPKSQQSEAVCHRALQNTLLCWKYVNDNFLISGVLLSQKKNRNKKYPKDVNDAVTKLVGKRCELSQLMAKAYLSQLSPRDVAMQISTRLSKVRALAEVFDNRALAEIYQHNYKIRAAIFSHAMGV